MTANGERFTLGLRSVASWEGQTGVKAYVMQVRWVVGWLVSKFFFLFFYGGKSFNHF